MGVVTEEEHGLRTKRLGVQKTVLSISQFCLNRSHREKTGNKTLKDKGDLTVNTVTGNFVYDRMA